MKAGSLLGARDTELRILFIWNFVDMGYFTELRDIVAGNFIGEIQFISQGSRFFFRQEVASIINEIQWPNFSIG